MCKHGLSKLRIINMAYNETPTESPIMAEYDDWMLRSLASLTKGGWMFKAFMNGYMKQMKKEEKKRKKRLRKLKEALGEA